MSASSWSLRCVRTPAGTLELRVGREGQVRLSWRDGRGGTAAREPSEHPGGARADELAERLRRYVAGEPVDFSDVPTPEGPDFYRRCWEACRRIPPGRTCSYAELAAHAGGGRVAARAAGQAMRANPLAVIVPCHRVVSSSGALHGYAGSCDPAGRGLRRKGYLLDLEQAGT